MNQKFAKEEEDFLAGADKLTADAAASRMLFRDWCGRFGIKLEAHIAADIEDMYQVWATQQAAMSKARRAIKSFRESDRHAGDAGYDQTVQQLLKVDKALSGAHIHAKAGDKVFG